MLQDVCNWTTINNEKDGGCLWTQVLIVTLTICDLQQVEPVVCTVLPEGPFVVLYLNSAFQWDHDGIHSGSRPSSHTHISDRKQLCCCFVESLKKTNMELDWTLSADPDLQCAAVWGRRVVSYYKTWIQKIRPLWPNVRFKVEPVHIFTETESMLRTHRRPCSSRTLLHVWWWKCL